MITARIDNITRIKPEYRASIIPAPESCKIELTSNCNFRCGFCAHRLRMKDRGDMEWDFYERICIEMAKAGVRELGVFYIGESMMLPWLPNAIRFAKENFEYVFLTTNGSLATPLRVKECMEAGLDSLKFSLNNATPEQLKEIAGVKPAIFWDILENIKSARAIRDQHGFKTKIYASSIRYDGEQQASMAAVIDEIRDAVDEHYWLPLYSMGSFARQREEELGFTPTAGNQGRLDNLRDPLPCWSAFTEAHITYDGKLSACCFDAGDKWVMADLNKVSFMKGWNSVAFQELRRAHLNKDVTGTICADCVAYV